VDEGNVFWWANSELTPRLEPLGGGRHQVVLAGVSVLDPGRLAGNAPLGPGQHRVSLFLRTLGVRRRPAVGIPQKLLAAGGAVTPGNAMLVRADTVRVGAKNQLQLDVRPAGRAAVRALARRPLTGRSSLRPSRQPLVLPLSTPTGLPPSRVTLPGREVRGELVSAGKNSQLLLHRETSLPTGRHRVTFGRKQPVADRGRGRAGAPRRAAVPAEVAGAQAPGRRQAGASDGAGDSAAAGCAAVARGVRRRFVPSRFSPFSRMTRLW
jgi:hypothetical protein